jgi:histone H3/H4
LPAPAAFQQILRSHAHADAKRVRGEVAVEMQEGFQLVAQIRWDLAACVFLLPLSGRKIGQVAEKQAQVCIHGKQERMRFL